MREQTAMVQARKQTMRAVERSTYKLTGGRGEERTWMHTSDRIEGTGDECGEFRV